MSVSYLRIPAADPPRLAAFYTAVFGWSSRDGHAFADATGAVIGHFSAEHELAGEAGVRPYLEVADVEASLAAVEANGGAVVTPVYPEGSLRVAVFRDPAGNVLGIWQRP